MQEKSGECRFFAGKSTIHASERSVVRRSLYLSGKHQSWHAQLIFVQLVKLMVGSGLWVTLASRCFTITGLKFIFRPLTTDARTRKLTCKLPDR